ncbi:hypothetical protein KP509_23G011200 [Ceratopteris richardii]|nr:hypothetical protein KP509_23G011200 [Ceratopteris richardii]KAH7301075.1 hypothetical protein KP509_23G011200 [Ceratopteris richardii]KAH7301076.1 hypothetical protein KP509_23G011200 [Ceratopteris richardii]
MFTMPRARVIFSVLVLLLQMIHGGDVVRAQFSCLETISRLTPCLPYTRGTMLFPTEFCCLGLQRLMLTGASSNLSTTVCDCLKADVTAFSVNEVAVANLPRECNATLGYALTMNFPCSLLG